MPKFAIGCDSLRPATRRAILRLTAMGAGSAFLSILCGKSACEETEVSRDEKEKEEVEGADDKARIVEEAYRLGHQYEKEHGGCAQCTLAALQDAIPFLKRDGDVFRAASALDGGATPTGVQNCGSFAGAGMAIGCLCGRRRNQDFEGSSKQAHKLIRKLYARFERDYGSVLCRDVREKADRCCPKVVGNAAKWTAEILLDEFNVEGPGATSCPPVRQHDKDRDDP